MAACKKSSHPLHHPKPPRRQRQAVAAYGSVFAGGVHRTPDGAAVALGHGVREFGDPKRIPRDAKVPQHIAVLVARLGSGKRWQGEGRHARVHNSWQPKLCQDSLMKVGSKLQ